MHNDSCMMLQQSNAFAGAVAVTSALAVSLSGACVEVTGCMGGLVV